MTCALTIGNFDGVHRGHQVLLQKTIEYSTSKQIESIAYTFEPHPRELLGSRPIPERLCTPEDKIQKLKSFGIQKVHVQTFDRQFSDLTAIEFLTLLKNDFNPRYVVVGENFFFGRNRSGSSLDLINWGKSHQIDIEILPTIEIDGLKVSSSEIRTALNEGLIQKVNKMCGYPYSVSGIQVQGDGRGRVIGIPTLNLSVPRIRKRDSVDISLCLPPHGVYVTLVKIENSTIEYPAITNFGIRPTFYKEVGDEFFESHVLIPWVKPMSESKITVKFLDRIRSEQRFASQDELLKQIQIDIAFARSFHALT